jgi:hypothetical protein
VGGALPESAKKVWFGNYVAVLNPQDDLHDRAISVSRCLDDCIFLTTENGPNGTVEFFR